MTTEEVALVIALTSMGVALVHFIARCVYKSKCDHCILCYGMVDIERNTEEEAKYDEKHRCSMESTTSGVSHV